MALLKAAIRVTHKRTRFSPSVHASAWEINTCDCCVLLSYICTKMDFMLLMLAVRILHSRALETHEASRWRVKLFDLFF